MRNNVIKLFLFMIPVLAFAEADWSRDYEVEAPRENLYELSPLEFHDTVMAGRKHALIYPVSVSRLAIPYRPLKTFFESEPDGEVRKLIFKLAKVVSPFKNMGGVFQWLGLHNYPTSPQPETPNPLPELTAEEMKLPMGATLMRSDDGEALTFGCAACHSADLFGVKVLGLTNRFPRANEFFRQGAHLAPYVNTFLFKAMLKATEGERLILVGAKHNLKFVGTKAPVSVGLDTSLAQVAISLGKRELDEYASRTDSARRSPRHNKLETMVADSKPAVWWNVKYKNRWLSDGSIVSGNPVHTNFLWNEIGRGTDLKELEVWLKDNTQTIEALTAAVFASKPPRYEKFFGENAINIEKAKRGQAHFVQSCQKCHGTYEKGWDQTNASLLSNTDLIQNVKVTYHKKTPVKDVGTDPGRYLGMNEFAADLNRLAISKAIGTVVEPQKGYVPPPLDGVWARWPYFHNNSVPNLCALLTPGAERPVTYVAGPAKNKETDFDQDCVGYPIGDKAPSEWKKDPDFFYDSRKEGLSNRGHDERIFVKEGVEIYSQVQKSELIEFLKTL
jgi:mono/diheme cytochrome c family protein